MCLLYTTPCSCLPHSIYHHHRQQVPALRQAGWRAPGQLSWHGPDPGAEPDWSEEGRFVAFTLPEAPGAAGGGLYVAFNASHLPVSAKMPVWDERAWRPLLITGHAAPFDVLAADERLSVEQITALQGVLQPWHREGAVPLLPYSCVVCVSEVAYEDA